MTEKNNYGSPFVCYSDRFILKLVILSAFLAIPPIFASQALVAQNIKLSDTKFRPDEIKFPSPQKRPGGICTLTSFVPKEMFLRTTEVIEQTPPIKYENCFGGQVTCQNKTVLVRQSRYICHFFFKDKFGREFGFWKYDSHESKFVTTKCEKTIVDCYDKKCRIRDTREMYIPKISTSSEIASTKICTCEGNNCFSSSGLADLSAERRMDLGNFVGDEVDSKEQFLDMEFEDSSIWNLPEEVGTSAEKCEVQATEESTEDTLEQDNLEVIKQTDTSSVLE